MNPTELINKFIAEEGKGSIRDALNVAIAKLEFSHSLLVQAVEERNDARKELDGLKSFAGNAWEINEKLRTEIDRYDKVCTEVRNELTATGIPELTEDRMTVLPLANRVYQLCARNIELEAVHKLTVDECNKSTGERNEARRQLQECRRERDEKSAIIEEARDAMEAIAKTHPYFVEVPAHNKCIAWLAKYSVE